MRLLNAANAQNFVLRFNDQRTFYVIASDGGIFRQPVALTQLTTDESCRTTLTEHLDFSCAFVKPCILVNYSIIVRSLCRAWSSAEGIATPEIGSTQTR